jgi:hypothetical protein
MSANAAAETASACLRRALGLIRADRPDGRTVTGSRSAAAVFAETGTSHASLRSVMVCRFELAAGVKTDSLQHFPGPQVILPLPARGWIDPRAKNGLGGDLTICN